MTPKDTLKIGLIFILAAIVSGCDDSDLQMPDQCMRVELFKSCMQLLPAGPVSTHYNDWDEVVNECDMVARKQSLRRKFQIKKDCQQ